MFKVNLKDVHPIQQGLFSMALVSLIAFICYILQIKSMLAWSMILSPVFLFSCYNPIIGAFKEKPLPYTAVSILVLLIISFYIYLLGNLVSDFSYQKTPELHLIAALVFIFYFLLSTLCIVFRVILYLLHEADR